MKKKILSTREDWASEAMAAEEAVEAGVAMAEADVEERLDMAEALATAAAETIATSAASWAISEICVLTIK